MVSTTISLDNKTPSTSDNSKPIAVPSAINNIISTTSANTTKTSGGINDSSLVNKFDLSSSLNEKISILFPKCRPKSDTNMNSLNNTNNDMISSTIMMTTNNTATTTTTESSTASVLKSSPNVVSTNPFLNRHLNSTEKVSYYYKTKKDYDFQSSSSNIPSYNLLVNHNQQLQAPQQQQQPPQQQPSHQRHNNTAYQNPSNNQNPFIKDNHYWDTNIISSSSSSRNRKSLNNKSSIGMSSSSASVLNSPDLNESVNYHKSVGHQIRVGRSPVSHNNATIADISSSSSLNNSKVDSVNNDHDDDIETTSKSMAVVADGEVVVFDDIGENWQNLKITPTDVKQPNHHLEKRYDDQLQHNHPQPPQRQHSTLSYSTYPSYSSLAKQNLSFDSSNVYKYKIDNYHNEHVAIDINQPAAEGKLEAKGLTGSSTESSLRNISGIMEYDGSPRRFGHQGGGGQNNDLSIKSQHNQTQQHQQHQQQKQQQQHQSLSYMYTSTTQNLQKNSSSSSSALPSPRPGFPQRVLMMSTHPTELNVPLLSSSCNKNLRTVEATDDTISDCKSETDDEHDTDEPREVPQQTAAEQPVDVQPTRNSTFDYLYEFSETRKVLEEFFKCPTNEEDKTLVDDDDNASDVDSVDIHYEFKENAPENDFAKYIGQRLASSPFEDYAEIRVITPKQNGLTTANNTSLAYQQSIVDLPEQNIKDVDYFLDSASRSSEEVLDNDGKHISRSNSRCYRYSPETTDYDSNCGDLDSLSGDFNGSNSYTTNYTKYYTSMPILEDGLSSGHASDTENNNSSGISVVMDVRKNENDIRNGVCAQEIENSEELTTENGYNQMEINSLIMEQRHTIGNVVSEAVMDGNIQDDFAINDSELHTLNIEKMLQSPKNNIFKNIDPELDSLYSINMVQLTPPPPAPAPHRKSSTNSCSSPDVQEALIDIKSILQRSKNTTVNSTTTNSNAEEKRINSDRSVGSPTVCSPIWIPRTETELTPLTTNGSDDDDEIDTDLETDRLLGHQHHGFYNEKNWCDRKASSRSLLSSSLSKYSPKILPITNSNLINQGLSAANTAGAFLPTTPEVTVPTPTTNSTTDKLLDIGGSISSPDHTDKSPEKELEMPTTKDESPTTGMNSNVGGCSDEEKDTEKKKKSKNKEVLIEGVLFRARYLGSTQLVCEGQPTKSTRMVQAEEAVSRIKALAPEGEIQPSTEVDLFISTEKIMVLNTDLKEIMMDHALRTISYIADIGDLVVLMARRRFVPNEMTDVDVPKPNRTPKMICHVFESDEAQFIAQSIGQAFQVAYMEFLKANGIEDHSFVKEMDYQEVLNSQEIFGDELEIFAKKELQKEVVVPKAKGEILGVVIVESGWGSMLPTVVIANLLSSGAAARCGQLNIGDQIIAINGMSLVGLPLSTCQNYIKNTKTQTVVKFTVVPCAPVVEVKIKRPNTKYQLGFSVQNGVICSLLRGGIAERGGVRVGHRIIEINNQSVVAVPHEKIVNLLATSVGEILMKTMPTSMFRLLTGQENPVYI